MRQIGSLIGRRWFGRRTELVVRLVIASTWVFGGLAQPFVANAASVPDTVFGSVNTVASPATVVATAAPASGLSNTAAATQAPLDPTTTASASTAAVSTSNPTVGTVSVPNVTTSPTPLPTTAGATSTGTATAGFGGTPSGTATTTPRTTVTATVTPTPTGTVTVSTTVTATRLPTSTVTPTVTATVGATTATAPVRAQAAVGVRAVATEVAVDLSVGTAHACAVVTSGQVWCWGNGTSGQLGNSANDTRTRPDRVNTEQAFASVSAGASHTCALTAAGAAWCWGAGNEGQLGNNNSSNYNYPVAVAGGKSWSAISAGYNHTCALATDGAAWCWGDDGSGQLGDDSQSSNSQYAPVAVAGGRTYVAIAAGGKFTCAIATGGGLWCWGSNASGQIGDGATGTNRASPVDVSGGKTWATVVAGTSNACAVTTAGAAWCWGDNSIGQVGNGQGGVGQVVATPIAVATPVGTSGVTWARVGVGDYHTCATTTGGVAYCWGNGDYGKVGDGTQVTARKAPVAVSGPSTWTRIGAGGDASCGLDSGGVPQCWGRNNLGQRGDGTGTDRATPASVIVSWGPLTEMEWASVSAGSSHTCGVSVAGQAWCWGSNANGQIGDGTTGNGNASADRWSPVAVATPDVGAVTWRSITAGEAHTCGVTTTGAAYCWGSNGQGQLGSGGWANPVRPAPVLGDRKWLMVEAGGYTTCGVAADGSAWCWGNGDRGQRGDGNLSWSAGTPVAVAAPTSGSVTWRTVNVGFYHACGITTDDALYCWGKNDYGQVGDQTNTNRSVPTQPYRAWAVSWANVAPGTGWDGHTCATTTAGTLYCWGYGGQGQTLVGYNQTAPTVVTNTQLASVKAIAAGYYHTCGTVNSDAMWCWGYSSDGQLGNGSSNGWQSIGPVTGNRTWAVVAAGNNHTCGILATPATLYCWGKNGNGQLGDGTTYQRNSPIASAPLAPTSSPTITNTPTATWTATSTATPDPRWSATPSLTPVPTATYPAGTVHTTWKKVVTGANHTCGLSENGTAYCWGNGNSFQLGTGQGTWQQVQPLAVSTGTRFTDIAAGNDHTCAVATDGSAWCWGSTNYGQAGASSWCGGGWCGGNVSAPTQMGGSLVWRSVVAGANHTCAITLAGQAYCWGWNSSGQLGGGSSSYWGQSQSVPQAVAGDRTWASLSAGYDHTCGVTTDGLGFCWGSGQYGQLGSGSTGSINSPALVGVQGNTSPGVVTSTYGVTTMTPGATATPSFSGPSSWSRLVAGNGFTCGLATGGKAWCWGRNANGQLGNGTQSTNGGANYGADQYLPMTLSTSLTFSAIGAGSDHACATTASGAAWCWGLNGSGQLGDGAGGTRSVQQWWGCCSSESVTSLQPVAVASAAKLSAVAGGSAHSCGVTTDGKAWCWGNNQNGQVGNASWTTPVLAPEAVYGIPVPIADTPTVTVTRTATVGPSPTRQPTASPQPTATLRPANVSWSLIATGDAHTCAIDKTGTASCWGDNTSGQLGDGSSGMSRTSPAPIGASYGSLPSFIALALGQSHSCALGADGTAWCWGSNGASQLGTSGSGTYATPYRVGGDMQWASLAAGSSHTCGITVSGNAYCWGSNRAGQLGDGTSGSDAARSNPALVAGGYKWKSIAAGTLHSCGVTTSGKAFCWGDDYLGQLGNGTAGDGGASAVPVAVLGTQTWTSVFASNFGTCAVSQDGKGWCWGDNSTAQVGDPASVGAYASAPTAIPSVSGVLSWSRVVPGNGHTCALSYAGAAWCWGRNSSGQLGSGTVTADTAATAVPVAVGGTYVWSSIDVGGRHVCATTAAGGAWCWGNNSSGQLGDTTRDLRSAPVAVYDDQGRPLTWKGVSAGTDHMCGTVSDGRAYCWGNAWSGQIGDGSVTTGSRLLPSLVAGGISWGTVSAGNSFTCALSDAGRAYCWGAGGSGQLGNGGSGTMGNTYVEFAPQAVSGNRTYGQIDVGDSFACALSGGDAWCWGNNQYGQVGDGTTTARATPVKVIGGQVWQSIATGAHHACAINTSGEAYCWGRNASGQLGDGTSGTTDPVTAPQAVYRGSNFASITGGRSHTCALTVAGAAWCWGSNSSGQLGDGTTASSGIPVAVKSTSNGGVVTTTYAASSPLWTSLGAGADHSCGTQSDGSAWCWGSMSSGQLGGGQTYYNTCTYNGYSQYCTSTSLQSSPRQVLSQSSGGWVSGWSSVATGDYRTCALSLARLPYCWGQSWPGLGDGSSSGYSASLPVAVARVSALLAPVVTPVPSVTMVPTAVPATATAVVADPVRTVSIVNVTESAFTVLWTTQRAVTGSIRWATGTAMPATAATDTRVNTGTDTVHSVTVRNLLPATRYAFDFVSGGVVDDNAGAHYFVTTSPALTSLPTSVSITGTVRLAAGGSPVGAHVVVVAQSSTATSAPIATTIETSNAGSYTLNLGDLRTQDRTSRFSFDDTTSLIVSVYAGSGGMARATTTVAAAKTSVPTITLASTMTSSLSINSGWNLIGVPLIPDVSLKASTLCAALNSTAGDGTSYEVDKFVDGGWFTHRCGVPANDFGLVPGEGYFVRSTRATTWAVTGSPHDGRLSMPLAAGWNLVAFPGQNGRFDAPALLASVNAAGTDGPGAVEIDRWEAGAWEGHVSGLPVNKFAITDSRGYFIRVGRPATWATGPAWQ